MTTTAEHQYQQDRVTALHARVPTPPPSHPWTTHILGRKYTTDDEVQDLVIWLAYVATRTEAAWLSHLAGKQVPANELRAVVEAETRVALYANEEHITPEAFAQVEAYLLATQTAGRAAVIDPSGCPACNNHEETK